VNLLFSFSASFLRAIIDDNYRLSPETLKALFFLRSIIPLLTPSPKLVLRVLGFDAMLMVF